MKHILLSADGGISVYRVPDEVAEHLDAYCSEFCRHWLYESPDAAKYRVKRGDTVCVHYSKRDFIDYLNQYICKEPSVWVASLPNVFCGDELPKEYAGLPYFNF